MSCCAGDGLISVEQALERLLGQAQPLQEVERVPLASARGRVLAKPLVTEIDLPPWPNSAMDGYAIRYAEADVPLPVSQKIFAGTAPEPLQPGTCARIFTGAPVPAGADAVEMQENTELLDEQRVRFLQPIKPGQHIRPQGGEARCGDVMLPAGTVIGPFELGLAASIGAGSLEVIRRPRVALLSTGDELIEPGHALGAGQIYNSNRYLLAAWLERLGCEVIDAGVLCDDLEAVKQRLGSLAGADLILSTGGVSVGEADFLGQALRAAGDIAFWKLAIKPGKPLTFGHYEGTPVIGLPGNPASTLVTFGMLARPYLLRRMGVAQVAPLGFEVPIGFDWPKPGTRREYLRARLEGGVAVLYANQSSSVLRGAAWAHGLVEIREGSTLRERDTATFIPFSELLG